METVQNPRSATEKNATNAAPEASGGATTILSLEGMTCASCAMRIEKGLRKVPGVASASVNLATERANVQYDPSVASVTDLVKKVEATGYRAAPVAPATSLTPPTPAQSPEYTTPEGTEAGPDAETLRRDRDLRHKQRTLLLGIALS
ncbi:MAG: heavy-metal-associated domain-containing protein, partial [Ktedonobacterales bacterium]